MPLKIHMVVDPDGRIRPKPLPRTFDEIKAVLRTQFVEVQRGYKTPCWEWTGRRNTHGYGTIWFEKKHQSVHRLSYLINKGPIQKDCVCHHCDNPPCFRPDHLFPGTKADNAIDSVKKGRHVTIRGTQHKLSKLQPEDVVFIRSHYVHGICGYKRLAKQFNVTPQLIYNIIKRKTWKHIP